MKKFKGIIFSMGIITLSTYKKYWSTDILYKNEHISSVLSREQFETILRFFNIGEKPHFQNNRFSKICLILNHLSENSFKWRVTVSGELMFLESYGNCDVTNTVTLLL